MAGAIIGALRAELSAATAQFQKDFENASKSVKRFADDFGKMGKQLQQAGAALSLAVTAPLTLFAKASTDAARDAEELQSKFNFVFKAMKTDMNAWAESQGDAMGRSTQTMQDLAATFGLLFNKAAPTARAAGDLSKEFSQLALDLSSFFNVTETDALEKLRAGLVGEAEPLRAFGVFLNAADVEARALQMGLAATNKELTEQDKILARANIIMEQTKVAQGDLARTADSAANQQRKLKEEWEELTVQVGQALLPILQKLTEGLIAVVEWFKNLDPQLQAIIGTAALVAAALGPVLIVLGTMAASISAIVRVVPALVAGMKAIGLTAATEGSKIGLMVKGLAALAAAPLAFEGGKAIGNDLGHQLGLMQAMLTYGISYEEANRLYEKGIADKLQAAKDGAERAAALRAAEQAAVEEVERQHFARLAALEEARVRQMTADAEAAAAAKEAAREREREIERQALADREAELQRERELEEEHAAWLDAFDRKWGLGEYAPDPMQDMEVENPYADFAQDFDVVADTLQNMPVFEVAADFEKLHEAIDMSVSALGAMIMDGRSAGDILKQLAQELLYMTLLGPALDGIANSIKGFFSPGQAGGNWFQGIADGVGSWFSNAFAGGFEEGGTIPRGSWGIVGEAGPEPVYAGSSDLQIFPNGSGKGNTQIFNIQTRDADSFRKSERQIARDARRRLQPEG